MRSRRRVMIFPPELSSTHAARPSGTAPLLVRAVLDGDADLVEALLSRGTGPNATDPTTGRTALMEAVRSNNADMVQTLLTFGADPNAVDSAGETALLHFLYRHDPADLLARLLVDLLEAGADPNVRTPHPSSWPALLLAAYKNDAPAVRCLIAHGADATATTPLAPLLAARDPEVVKALLEAGADPLARAGDGSTALLQAARSGRTELCHALVEAGAPVDHSDDAGRTALLVAAAAGRSGLCAVLLGSGADPRRSDHAGTPPLVAAAAAGHTSVCSVLLASVPADVDQPDATGRTALMAAVAAGHKRVAALLLVGGADLSRTDAFGRRIMEMTNDPMMSALLAPYQAAVDRTDLRRAADPIHRGDAPARSRRL